MRAGDRIIHHDSEEAIVLFVLGQSGCVSGEEEDKAWMETQEPHGFMFRCKSMGLAFYNEPDEDFVLLQRQGED